ncbi:MAG: ribosome small subunit-dependent GTPase A [Deltaproteobacteria bacterium]|nr:ribosome small subunit-dependent GTPase A [Deltaproteobacteria bacterium]
MPRQKGPPKRSGGRSGRSGRGRASSREGKAEARRREQGERDARARTKLRAAYADRPTEGLVLCMYGSHADIQFEDGQVGFCLLHPKVHKLFGLCVGDRVWTDGNASVNDRVVMARADRETELRRTRSEEDHSGHVIAANLQRLAITAALHEPPLRTGALDRYLLLASTLGIEPILVLTKIDLAPMDDPGWDVLAPYRELGVLVVPTSAESGEGLDELRAALKGRVTAFAGHSGVGKSALCQALGLAGAPKTGTLSMSGGRARGKHTTSIAQLLELPTGGWVVDTPGIRAIGLVDLQREDVAVHFPELAELAPGCEYGDCLHLNEDGCAVRDAVDEGELSAARYDGYRKLIESIE